MVHLSDLDWNRPGEQVIDDFKKGDIVQARFSTWTSRRSASRSASSSLRAILLAEAGEIKKGQIVTCEVLEVKDGGLEVKIVDTDLSTFIKRNELARDRADQRPERFAAGEKLDARVTQFDRKARRVTVSIKALEVAGGEGSHGCSTARPIRVRRSATSSAPPEGQGQEIIGL